VIRLSRFRRGCPTTRPAHRLVRDAVEAEELAVEWLRWWGLRDVHRTGTAVAQGIVARGLVAHVAFDPLPMEQDELERTAGLLQERSDRFVSFTFAGWTPDALAWAERHGVPLIRFSFAGIIDLSNGPARRLGTPPRNASRP